MKHKTRLSVIALLTLWLCFGGFLDSFEIALRSRRCAHWELDVWLDSALVV